MCERHPIQCIIPPYINDHLAKSADPATRARAVANLKAGAAMRAMRVMAQAMPSLMVSAAPTKKKNREVYDGKKTDELPGKLVRSEGDAKVADKAVNEAYDHSGSTYDFYDTVFSRNSLDDKGMTLVSTVHVAEVDDTGKFVPMNNAFWNGEQMAYGDGDGVIFRALHRLARRRRPRADPRRRVVHQQSRVPEPVRRAQRALRRRVRRPGPAVEERARPRSRRAG